MGEAAHDERLLSDRSGEIRTHDPYYPKVVRYQAALRPVSFVSIA